MLRRTLTYVYQQNESNKEAKKHYVYTWCKNFSMFQNTISARMKTINLNLCHHLARTYTRIHLSNPVLPVGLHFYCFDSSLSLLFPMPDIIGSILSEPKANYIVINYFPLAKLQWTWALRRFAISAFFPFHCSIPFSISIYLHISCQPY